MNPDQLKLTLQPYQQATATFESAKVQAVLSELFASDAVLHMYHPFGTLEGPDAYFQNCIGKLIRRCLTWNAET